MLATDLKSKLNRRTELLASMLEQVRKKHFSKQLAETNGLPVSIIHDVDVAVVGGGISGIVSALASARNGAKTVLVEQQGAIGGLCTMGLIPPISNQFFLANGFQIIKGIAEEIMDRLAEDDGTMKEWRDWKVPKYPFDIEVFKLVVYDLLKEADVTILLNTFFSKAVVAGDRIDHIIVENITGRNAIKAKFFIDCSANASLAISSGVPTNANSDLANSDSMKDSVSALMKRIGWSERTEKTASLQFAIANVNFDKLYDYVVANPGNYDVYYRGELKEDIELFRYLWHEKGLFYIPHTRNFEDEINKAKADKFFKKHTWRYRSLGECGISLDGLRCNGLVTVTANKVTIDPFQEAEITKSMVEGQEICFEAWRFFKEYIPGFEESVLISIAPFLGIRRAAQIIGERVLTVEEREEERKYEDVIGFYSRKTVMAREIPYFCMVPQAITNLLVASGKSVSTDDFVMFRTKPHCMILGQAAGTAVGLCAKTNQTLPALDIKLLQKTLYRQGVYLGDKSRLEEIGILQSSEVTVQPELSV